MSTVDAAMLIHTVRRSPEPPKYLRAIKKEDGKTVVKDTVNDMNA